MPKRVSELARNEQPIRWGRAITCGMISVSFMMAFIDTFYMMELTPFSFEIYLGSLIHGSHSGDHIWTVGFLANLVTGGLFGVFYAYCFEYVFYKANTKLGIWVSVWHVVAASVAIFPFFNVMHEFIGTGTYPRFGILGSGLGLDTAVMILIGHFLFGSSMGLFYGGVRAVRVREGRLGSEPGETGKPGEPGVITDEDAEDRVAV
jgi:hypothetical protein